MKTNDELNKSIEEITPEYDNLRSEYSKVSNRKTVLELAKRNDKVGKLAQETISIREELGDNPKIVKMEKDVVSYNNEVLKSQNGIKNSFVRLLFVAANLIVAYKADLVPEETIQRFAAIIMALPSYSFFSKVLSRITDFDILNNKGSEAKQALREDLKELNNEISKLQNEVESVEIDRGKTI